MDSTNHHFWWSRQSLVLAILCRCFPSWEALLWAILARACTAYSSSLAVWVRVTPTCLPSQMARSFIRISTEGCDPDLYSVWMESHSSLLQGAGSSLVSTSEAHWPASLNSCIMHCLAITPLVGVVALNHIQMSTSDRLSEPSSSYWMVAGTPSGLCCYKDSIAHMSSGVSSQILKHNGSLIPRKFTRCSGTGLHGNPTDGSPGGGRLMLEDGPETLFFITMQSTVILFSTPSLSQ